MKVSFSDNLFSTGSFIEICNIAKSYGFDAIEIADAKKEKKLHRTENKMI